MKKIGIINKVEFSGPGTRNIFYIDPEVDGYKHISYLSAFVCDITDIGFTVKKVTPKIEIEDCYFPGNIIEYDEETNTITSVSLFRELTENEMNQIDYIYQHFSKKLNTNYDFDSVIQYLSNCQNMDEIKRKLQQIDSKSLYEKEEEIMDAEQILRNINFEMLCRYKIKENQKIDSTNIVRK